jgi:hypothetical protein
MNRFGIVALTVLISLTFLIPLSGCAVRGPGFGVHVGDGPHPPVGPPPPPPHARGGPPPHAPAHGYRAKYTYYYYPDAGVYFDTARQLYFYMDDGRWRISVSLPRHLHVRLDDHVTIHMNSDRPYTHYRKHKKKFPPGQMKKKHKKKNWKKW